jgi:hypothetical protein
MLFLERDTDTGAALCLMDRVVAVPGSHSSSALAGLPPVPRATSGRRPAQPPKGEWLARHRERVNAAFSHVKAGLAREFGNPSRPVSVAFDWAAFARKFDHIAYATSSSRAAHHDAGWTPEVLQAAPAHAAPPPPPQAESAKGDERGEDIALPPPRLALDAELPPMLATLASLATLTCTPCERAGGARC